MADTILQAELVENSNDFKHLTAIQLPNGKALLISIGAGGIIPVASWKSSGTLVGAANAVLGFAADVPSALATSVIQYPRGAGSTRVLLSIFVTFNNFLAVGTVFTLYRNGIATASNTPVAAGVAGLLAQTTFNLAYAIGDTYDLGVSNAGGGAEVGKTISFGSSVDFLLI